MRRILAILAILAAITAGTVWYAHRAKMRALNSGDVYVREQPVEPVDPGEPAPLAQPETATANQTLPPVAAQPSSPAQVVQGQAQPAAIPAQDSISRNPPSGMTFQGSGKYQLYRQGDITWRLNTESGDACILFATDAQWRRSRVYERGCAARREAAAATGN